jgi:cyclopropane-fatty-acyl-phospholipid synthase
VRARRDGLYNVGVTTADVNRFEAEGRFDRVVSVEMFEHVRNWEALLERVAGWLASDGRAFLHHFCHRELAYLYEDRGANDWMARHFFSGGMMPSADLAERCARSLRVDQSWPVDGPDYARTCEAWLRNLDAERGRVRRVFAETYGSDQARRWIGRWRLFFLACAELFAYDGGREWFVSHVRLAKR